MNDYKKDIDDFINGISEEIIDKQKEIVHFAMDELFQTSPHYDDPVEYAEIMSMTSEQREKFFTDNPDQDHVRSRYALSQYDANHKVATNTQPMDLTVNPPTRNIAISNSLNHQQASNVDSIDELGDTAVMANPTPHTFAVETGVGWHSGGYAPYFKTAWNISNKYRAVLT